jgi:excisionase family DNA binding protein
MSIFIPAPTDAAPGLPQSPRAPIVIKPRRPRRVVEPDSHLGEHSVVPQLLTITQVSSLLAVTSRHIYRLVAAGEFPRPVSIGRATRFVASEVAAYVEGQRV